MPTPVGFERVAQAVETARDRLPYRDGTWGYVAGNGGTVALTGGKRVTAARFLAVGAVRTITINGGSPITLRTGDPWVWAPGGVVEDPTIVISGNCDYMIEYVTPA